MVWFPVFWNTVRSATTTSSISNDPKQFGHLPHNFYKTLFFRVFPHFQQLFFSVPQLSNFRNKLLSKSFDDILNDVTLLSELPKQINKAKTTLQSFINVPFYHEPSNTIICFANSGLNYGDIYEGTDGHEY